MDIYLALQVFLLLALLKFILTNKSIDAKGLVKELREMWIELNEKEEEKETKEEIRLYSKDAKIINLDDRINNKGFSA